MNNTKQNLFKSAILAISMVASTVFASEPLEVNNAYQGVYPASAKASKMADNQIGLLFLYSQAAKDYKGAPYLSDYILEQTEVFQNALYKAGSDLDVKTVGIEAWSYDDLTSLDNVTTQTVLTKVSTNGTFEPRTIAISGMWPDKMEAIGADYVIVMKTKADNDNNNCGRSYVTKDLAEITSEDSNPFIHVQNIDDTCGAAILAHEIGHNLGGNHTPSDASFSDYASAHECDGNGTIMWADGFRNQFYSTPEVSVDGVVCGDAETSDMKRLVLEHVGYIASKSTAVTSPNLSVHAIQESDRSAEEGVTLTFSVKRDVVDNPTTVYLTGINGSATSSDYSINESSLSFESGVDMLSFDVSIIDDGNEEPDETFSISIETLGVDSDVDPDKSSVQVTIAANDKPAPTEPENGGSSGGGGSTSFVLLVLLGLAYLRKRH